MERFRHNTNAANAFRVVPGPFILPRRPPPRQVVPQSRNLGSDSVLKLESDPIFKTESDPIWRG